MPVARLRRAWPIRRSPHRNQRRWRASGPAKLWALMCLSSPSEGCARAGKEGCSMRGGRLRLGASQRGFASGFAIRRFFLLAGKIPCGCRITKRSLPAAVFFLRPYAPRLPRKQPQTLDEGIFGQKTRFHFQAPQGPESSRPPAFQLRRQIEKSPYFNVSADKLDRPRGLALKAGENFPSPPPGSRA